MRSDLLQRVVVDGFGSTDHVSERHDELSPRQLGISIDQESVAGCRFALESGHDGIAEIIYVHGVADASSPINEAHESVLRIINDWSHEKAVWPIDDCGP